MPDTREVIDSSDRSDSPVFVDVTGRRRRRLRRLGYAAAALCGGYSIMIGISLVGGPVSPQTLLPKVGGGDTKVVPSPKHRPPADDGPAALTPARPSWPVQTPRGAPAVPRASGSAPSGALPSPAPPDEQRTGPQAPAGTPAATPRRSAGPAPAAPPTGSTSPSASPPETGEPAADERRGDAEAESTGAEPQAAAATPVAAENSPTAPAAGAQG